MVLYAKERVQDKISDHAMKKYRKSRGHKVLAQGRGGEHVEVGSCLCLRANSSPYEPSSKARGGGGEWVQNKVLRVGTS